MSTTEYPQDAKPVKNRRTLKIVLASILGAAVIVAASWGAVAYANGVTAQRAHLTAVAEQHQVAVALPHLQAQTAAIADESDTSTADAVVAAEKTREAQVAAEQAAAAAKTAQEATIKKCPAGSVAGAVDGNGNESNCRGENGNGEVCQAYDDANNCTAWGKP